MPEVLMPRFSDSMEEGTIVSWLVDDGAVVTAGQEIVEIETDKATMAYAADADGVIAILAAAGDTVVVGGAIARIGESAVAPTADDDPAAGAGSAQAPDDALGHQPATAAESDESSVPGPQQASRPTVKASPVARRMAREMGLALEAIQGTGPGGRIVKEDVLAATSEPVAPSTPSPPAPVQTEEPGSAKGAVVTTEPTRVQQLIARRMAESRATIPAFTLRATIDMTRCVDLRTTLKVSGAESRPSYNDLVVKACAIALAEHPSANGGYRDGKFERYSRVNIGVAVAADGSLVVPTIFDADRKGLSQITAETRTLAERVREGTITPPELSGGTFTVSNLGMYGVRSFEAVINPPQAAILSVGALEARAVVRDGEVVVRRVMDVELACDHRILYGAPAAELLARIRDILEAPLSLAL